MTNWSVEELSYLAGIIDGEGCFCLHDYGTHRFASQLQIGNTDLRLMEWIQRHFGGTVREERRSNPRHKRIYRWWSTAKDLEAVTRAVLPYLIVKRQQAELMLAYRATIGPTIRTRPSTNDTPDATKEARFEIHRKLRALNKRGSDVSPMESTG